MISRKCKKTIERERERESKGPGVEREIANEQARWSRRATVTVRTGVKVASFVIVSLTGPRRGSTTATRTVAPAPASVS